VKSLGGAAVGCELLCVIVPIHRTAATEQQELSGLNDSSFELPEYLESLNEQQLKGALHFEGPILILAGAGSGKTRVLTHRVAHLIDYYSVRPESILAVTFTNKAAGEMKERLTNLLGDKGNRVWASTFHSLGPQNPPSPRTTPGLYERFCRL
jgi:ATP-dependent exoDNAse (exonuclease V) beta subunit